MTVRQLFLIGYDVFIVEMVSHGVGRHLLGLLDPMASALQLSKYLAIYQVLNITGAFFIKLLISSTRALKLAVWAVSDHWVW